MTFTADEIQKGIDEIKEMGKAWDKQWTCLGKDGTKPLVSPSLETLNETLRLIAALDTPTGNPYEAVRGKVLEAIAMRLTTFVMSPPPNL